MRAARGTALVAAATLLAPAILAAQTLEQRVLARKDATVRLAYATKPGVCGNGDRGVSLRGQADGWTPDCEQGPAHVTIRVSGGEVTDISTRVGGRWLPKEGVTDLGTVPPREATRLFLGLARRDDRGANDAIFAAMIADSADVWRDLLAMARTSTLRKDVRKSAVFWVGQEAADAATRGLREVVGDASIDRDVRESAVFALSQRPRDEAVPALLDVARTNQDPKLRRSAIFWLGQTEDPRALAYFEEVLGRPAR
ncbi:MAG TPA: HEAT repeat domain-containing protein [Gemmatimonadales bacterium]|nr:HEAT repeat domain-containing protein [Gemmatimonadales bacterium]